MKSTELNKFKVRMWHRNELAMIITIGLQDFLANFRSAQCEFAVWLLHYMIAYYKGDRLRDIRMRTIISMLIDGEGFQIILLTAISIAAMLDSIRFLGDPNGETRNRITSLQNEVNMEVDSVWSYVWHI